MRMIGIGLMGFLLAGVALLLSTMNILEKGQRYVSDLTNGPQLIFESRVATSASGDHKAMVYRSTSNHPVILSGLPAYQGVAFALPIDARPTSGYLQIDATSQVLSGVEGVLRISIDNTRRGEVLLRPGEVGHTLRIPLSPTDFARDELVVSFSLQGTSARTTCSSDAGVEAIVEIETTSSIFLTLDRPLSSPRDRVLSWGRLVQVGWPDWLASDEKLRRIALATRFKQHGIEAAFAGGSMHEGLSTIEMRSALEHFEATPLRRKRATWPIHLANKGANAGVRRFHRSTEWRSRIDLRHPKDTLLPEALDLHLALGLLPGDNRWSVVVTLNGRLLAQDRLDLGQQSYSTQVVLPADMLSVVNVIEVTASATYNHDGICDKGPELVAEMLPSSALLPGIIPFSDDLLSLQAALVRLGPMTLGSPAPLTAMDAAIAVDLLAEILPLDVKLKPALDAAQIVIVPPSSDAVSAPEAAPGWLVYRDPETRGLAVRALAGEPQVKPTSVAVMIIPNGLSLDGSAS